MQKPRVETIVITVAAMACIALLTTTMVTPRPSVDQWGAVAFFGLFGLLASLLGYSTANGTTGTIGFLPFLTIALISPNYAALIVVAVSVAASELIAKRSTRKAIFNVSQQLVAQGGAVSVYTILGGEPVLNKNPPAVAFLSMVTAFFAINKIAVSAVISASTGGAFIEHWKKSMKASAGYDVFAFPLILVFSIAYRQFGPQWSMLIALPMLGTRQLYKQNFALQKINEELLQLIIAAIEARDEYTSGHSQRVSQYARTISRAVGLTPKQTERIATAALLHDVGKIHEEFGPILRKADQLNVRETAIMKTHPARGAVLVGKVSHFADLVPEIAAHHEAWNGSGYPMQLAGENIPFAARIIAIADTIDAMGTDRPYRLAMDIETIRAELADASGRQFDPAICTKLLQQKNWEHMSQEIKAAAEAYPALANRVGPARMTAEASLPLTKIA
jgi:putative nucleotidyltransferase with HDIG domain